MFGGWQDSLQDEVASGALRESGIADLARHLRELQALWFLPYRTREREREDTVTATTLKGVPMASEENCQCGVGGEEQIGEMERKKRKTYLEKEGSTRVHNSFLPPRHLATCFVVLLRSDRPESQKPTGGEATTGCLYIGLSGPFSPPRSKRE